MTAWIKSLAATACLLTIFLRLVPENRFAKYVRFYAGLLFFLLAVQPVLELLGSADELERLLQLEFLKEEYYDLESAAEGLNDLKNAQILEAYQSELKRQTGGILSAYGLTALEVQIGFGEDGYSVEQVFVQAEIAQSGGKDNLQGASEPSELADQSPAGDDTGNGVDAAVKELANLYMIPESEIAIVLQND